MIVDVVDKLGRRYVEVPIFPDGPLKRAFAYESCDACADCGVAIRHGWDRYFQRNDHTDGEGRDLAALLMAVTYDAVCGRCGDRVIAESAA